MTLRRWVDRYVTERVILAVGWVCFLIYAYPGYMSYDGAYQLAQARHIEKVNEWHPPLMTILWRYLDDVIAGPFPMLVLQSLLFLFGVRALLKFVLSSRAATIVAVVLLLIPQNIVIMAVIWKDPIMAGCLVWSVVCLFSERRPKRILGYLAIFVATAFRYNAAAATMPIVVLQFAWRSPWPRWRKLVLGFGLWVAITGLAFVISNAFIEQRTYPWQTSVALTDIAGVIRWAPHLDNDQLLRDTPGVPWHKTDKIQIRVRTWYRPDNSFLNLTNEPGQVFDYPTTDEHRAALTNAWKKLVTKYPFAYALHRLSVFRAQLFEDEYVVLGSFTDPVYDQALGHRATHSPLQEKWLELMLWLDATIIFRTSIYFFGAIILLVVCRKDRLSVVLLASGLANELGLLIAAPTVGFRYSHWLANVTMFVVIMLFTRRYRLGKKPQER